MSGIRDRLVGLARSATFARRSTWLFWTAVGLYYLRFIKRPDGMTLYPLGARCLLEGQPLASCAEGFTYPPAFALAMVPFAPMPMWARNLVWYAVSIALLYGSVRLGERLVVAALGLNLDDGRRWWLRSEERRVGKECRL